MKSMIACAVTLMTLFSLPVQAQEVPFDLTEALEQRYDGKMDAPVVFYDFSSLSCPHCAHFHDEIYPRIKAEFLDTGKAQMIFGPMPLNAAALDGEKIARCLPKAHYLDAIKLLFSNQAAWATGEHRKNLIEQAKMLGLSPEKAQACLENKELENGILQMVKDDAYRFNVQSTPTFIFEEGERELKGVGSYDKYKRLIEYLYEQKTSTEEKTEIPSDSRLTVKDLRDADQAAMEAKAARMAEKAAEKMMEKSAE